MDFSFLVEISIFVKTISRLLYKWFQEFNDLVSIY